MEQTPLLTADAESLRPVVLEVFGTTDPSCESRRTSETFDPSPKVAWMGETMAKKVLAMTERCQTSEVFITWKTLRKSLRWKLFLSSGVKSCGEAFPYIHIDPALEWSVSLVTEPIFLTASQQDRTHWSGHRPGQLMAGVSFCCSDWVLSDIEFLSFNLRWLWKFTNQNNVKCYSKYNVGWPENTLEGLINTNQHS